VGQQALYQTTEGESNTGVGYNALYNNVTGLHNAAFGYGAGPGAGNYFNTLSLGNLGVHMIVSNRAHIGNLNTTWNGGNTFWSTYSDARVKRDITEDVKGLEFITRLRPVMYYRNISAQRLLTKNEDMPDYPGKYDIEKIKFSGFLAQEVEQAASEIGYDFCGVRKPENDRDLYTLSYEAFVVPLVKAVQEQQILINDLKKEIEFLKKAVADLQKQR